MVYNKENHALYEAAKLYRKKHKSNQTMCWKDFMIYYKTFFSGF